MMTVALGLFPRLVDATWPARYPPGLAARLQELLDTPDG
jgi:hypothetical protein